MKVLTALNTTSLFPIFLTFLGQCPGIKRTCMVLPSYRNVSVIHAEILACVAFTKRAEPLSTDDPSRLPTIPRNQCSDGASITIIDGWDGGSDCCQCERPQWCVAESPSLSRCLCLPISCLSLSVFPYPILSFLPSIYFSPYILFPLECEWNTSQIKVICKPPHTHTHSHTHLRKHLV